MNGKVKFFKEGVPVNQDNDYCCWGYFDKDGIWAYSWGARGEKKRV